MSLKTRLEKETEGLADNEPIGSFLTVADIREALTLLERARPSVKHDRAWVYGYGYDPNSSCSPDCLRCALDAALEEPKL